jgi:hypothetical protein
MAVVKYPNHRLEIITFEDVIGGVKMSFEDRLTFTRYNVDTKTGNYIGIEPYGGPAIIKGDDLEKFFKDGKKRILKEVVKEKNSNPDSKKIVATLKLED